MSERDIIAAAYGAADVLGGTGQGRRFGWLVDVIEADRNYRQGAGEPRDASDADRDGGTPGNLPDTPTPFRNAPLPGDGGTPDHFPDATKVSRSSTVPGATLVAEAVRHDRPLTMAEVIGNVDATKLTCHDGIVRVPAALVALVAEKLGDGELLDLGCGDGALAAAVLASAPGARARLVDRDVRAASRLRGARCEVIAADLATLEVAPANVVLLSNVLHTSTAPRELVARATAHVAPGGALIVREVALAADRKGPRFGLAFGLSLLLFGDAELPREDELAAWLSPRERHYVDESIVLVA